MTSNRRLTKFAREQLKNAVKVEYTMVAFEVVAVDAVATKVKPVSEADRVLLQELEPDELFLSKRA